MTSYLQKNVNRGGLSARLAWFLFAVILPLVCTSCGDVYRPVAQPIIGPPPNPAALHFVAAIATDGAQNRGSASRIDVSGDTTEGLFPTGILPSHAALTANGARLFVANSGEDTVSSNNPSTPTVSTTIALPSGSKPVFVHTTENGKVYVANAGNGTVSVINANSNVVIATVAVGSNPVALAEMPNAQKLYVLNQGSGSVTVINTVDDTVGATIPVGSSPAWIVARSDNARVYALDSSGTIYAIDTLSDTVVGTSSSGGTGANFLLYDQTLNALLVTNSGSGTVSILDASTDPPTLRPNSPITIAAPAVAGYPCLTAPVPDSVAVLSDGRAYVASYQLDSGLVCTQATVVNTTTGSVKNVIPLTSGVVDTVNPTGCASARFRVFTVASGGGTTSNFKVYVSQCDAGSVAVIDTFATQTGVSPHAADVFTASIGATPSTFPPTQVAISAAAQNSSTTTYTYSPSNSGLQPGMRVFVTGMTDASNNGVFAITALDPVAGTFAVSNPVGVTTSAAQSGSGTVLPPQNPVFLVAGP
jgi:YVTN family beta-propeller protein